MQEYLDFFQQNLLLSVIWIGIFLALMYSVIQSSTAPYKQLSAAEATQMMNRENGVVVDIRSKDEYRGGHITNALNILPSDIKADQVSLLEKHKADPIILVCKMGQHSPESAKLLVKKGYENVNVLKNGLISWNDANLPLVRGKK